MTTFKKRHLIRIKEWLQRQTALFLALVIFIQVAYPTHALALTGGPSQPEVQSFEPVGTSDMVDLFSGDFNYNIPLLDVEGYPINISYHSGINMDQEASWVGLGWNINPGVINRSVRGLPDDFAGESVVKQFNMKANKTWGVAGNASIEIFGSDKLGLGSSYGFNFNNYSGPSVIKSFNVNISAGLGGGGRLNGGLGLTSSSDEGLTVQPSLSFSKKIDKGGMTETSLGLSVGTAMNSRGGLKQLSINASASTSLKGSTLKSVDGSSEKTVEYKKNSRGALGNKGAGGTFDFGQPTYTPKIDMPMKNFSMSGNFTLGGELAGVHGKLGLSGFYSAQELATTTISSPAYGYLYSEKGQFKDDVLLDFNREKDGTFTDNTPSLPLTNLTFDIYGVSGQGIGGSYRPFRGDISYVFDAASYTTNDNDALTAEIGVGGYAHAGTNISVIDVSSQSGKWKEGNAPLSSMIYTNKGMGNDFENIYFKEANEKTIDSDPSFFQTAGADKAVRFDVDLGKFDHRVKEGFVDQNGGVINYSGAIKRKKRDKRTQNISFLKYSEYNELAVDNSYFPLFSGSAQDHHIAEINTMATDGKQYIYGLPAYNTLQKEVTFSIGSTDIHNHTNNSSLTFAPSVGMVSFSGSDNSLNNAKGLDNYYSSTETPPYAHSYLLTSVLSHDYIDADSVRGPSDKDFGSYTKFIYEKVSGFQWRVPCEAMMASYTEGLKSDFTDDKANIIYGAKDLYFLDSIITRNYFAIFHKSPRQDGLGVSGELGGVSSSKTMMRLDSISLYSKRDRSTPVKRVHFEYTYDLCRNISNNSVPGQGKLTLKKIFFTYRNSNKAKLSPYQFDYHENLTAENPNYNPKGYDRWGNYKPNNASTTGVSDNSDPSRNANSFISTAVMPAADYPYVVQDRSVTDVYTAAWCLKEIYLPSGGSIKVSYESDDYAYVQNKKAAQMFKIINYVADTSLVTAGNVDQSNTLVNFSAPSGFFIFRAAPGTPLAADYRDGIQHVYFRFLQNIRTTTKPHLEYVSGYGEYQSLGFIRRGGVYYGCLKLNNVNLKDNGSGSNVNPVVKAGVNFGRLHLPKVVWDATKGNFNGTLNGSILSAMINASFIKNIRDAVAGPSQSLFQNYNVARTFVAEKSWMRLNNPSGHQLGGGTRVKKIELNDNWLSMVSSSSSGNNSVYGQEYFYDLPDGRSSGVATYEPQLGGDENPFRQPVFVNTKKLLVPDDESYVEEPFGESFFPTPSVGYSYVTVRNLQRANVKRHATGKIIHEFYTARDFPTITDRTEIKARRGKDGPGSLRSLLKINVRDYFAATQGFVIELNDMHGKPKAQSVFQEGQSTPVTSIEYRYKCQPWLNGSFRLANECTTISKNGSTGTHNLGMFFDMVGDFRESRTETDSKALEINVDVIPIFGFPAPIPGLWPGFAKDKSRFRSATLTKVIQRFGILEETISKDLGSVVSSKNLAYDAETGDLLLTQTTTNYNDKVYSFKYPAWWYYDLMGPAYTNTGYEQNSVVINAGGFAALNTANMFKEGDIVAFFHKNGSITKTWVYSISGNLVSFIKHNGESPAPGNYRIKILKSGRRNNLTTEMASIVSLSNPLESLTSNAYQNVLQASAVEFYNHRETHCNCPSGVSDNPFLTGKTGVWYPYKNYTHLTTRSQSNTNGNSNIRKDGVFESYTPFYRLSGNGSWQIDARDWTYIQKVNEYNVSGNETESIDALNRYSSASFGYNQTHPLSVAANSRYKEQGFDGFEDYRFNPCADDHFKIATADTTRDEAHTGLYSLFVPFTTPVTYTRQLLFCSPVRPGCNIQLTSAYTSSGHQYVVSVSGHTGAYNFSYSILSGASNNPQCTVSGGAFQVSASGPYRIAVTVQDSKGCQTSLTLTTP
jgi:hypothetical protein